MLVKISNLHQKLCYVNTDAIIVITSNDAYENYYNIFFLNDMSNYVTISKTELNNILRIGGKKNGS